jgi:hypothetical protein
MHARSRTLLTALALLATTAHAEAESDAGLAAEWEAQAYAYFSLTIAEISVGDVAAAQQAAQYGMQSVIAALADPTRAGPLLEIYTSLEGYLVTGSLYWQSTEFAVDGIYAGDMSDGFMNDGYMGDVYYADYATVQAVVTQELTPKPIDYGDAVRFDSDPWADYGPGEQSGSSGSSGGSSDYCGAESWGDSWDYDDAVSWGGGGGRGYRQYFCME